MRWIHIAAGLIGHRVGIHRAGRVERAKQIMRPVLPLPDGDRLVEIELENVLLSEREPRMLYDFGNWRRDLRSGRRCSSDARGQRLFLLMFGEENIPWGFVRRGLLITSLVMMAAGILACLAPARRALRINPIDALKEA